MKKNFKYLLEERLKYMLIWKNNCLEYFKHQEITEKTKNEYFKNRKVESFFYYIYFLPLNTLRFFKKRKQIKTFNKGLTEIQILEEELNQINNIQENRRING
tara:strand:- start:85 stop:390 length:306 start_codon:yes stop_codon:yes gene_type:complete